jgi:hypothetical protein
LKVTRGIQGQEIRITICEHANSKYGDSKLENMEDYRPIAIHSDPYFLTLNREARLLRFLESSEAGRVADEVDVRRGGQFSSMGRLLGRRRKGP